MQCKIKVPTLNSNGEIRIQSKKKSQECSLLSCLKQKSSFVCVGNCSCAMHTTEFSPQALWKRHDCPNVSANQGMYPSSSKETHIHPKKILQETQEKWKSLTGLTQEGIFMQLSEKPLITEYTPQAIKTGKTHLRLATTQLLDTYFQEACSSWFKLPLALKKAS